ncbi:hypothetical protein, partial [Pseudomonas sp. GW460-13]|uniref:hypothetical protein n=1 Tax=Pseudomonas sp. GW460-13 TaxID=2070590 RepID=UPI001C4643D3
MAVGEPAKQSGISSRAGYAADSATALPAERKHLSVLCARVREPISVIDHEPALERVDAVLKAMVDSVQRFGGLVTQL